MTYPLLDKSYPKFNSVLSNKEGVWKLFGFFWISF
ncbi:hypothetical protein LSS_22605 [Leptospira santarosai serovar Shermani str. LT 821]|uniref:Uncharacterized protein n=1 Tax=Leptospira santarosai serovar Shermani str. LT 821 TaxID=758847 RepID=A0A097ESV2_9LEPT|nr:hypothetical protein LSS_22605 [Leptospira santarosai serovar Shermani str. LT 821]